MTMKLANYFILQMIPELNSRNSLYLRDYLGGLYNIHKGLTVLMIVVWIEVFFIYSH